MISNKPFVLRLALIVQLGFFVIWAGVLYHDQKNAPKIWLETTPVDPRDYISGNYLTLSFPIANPSNEQLPPSTSLIQFENSVWVELKQSTTSIQLSDQVIFPYVAVRYERTKPSNQTENNFWVKGSERYSGWRQRLNFGIEKFFISEGSDLKFVRGGDVVTQASINKSGSLRLVKVVKIKK